MTSVQDEFVPLFKQYMDSEKTYKPLANFINSHNEKDLRDCLSIYFIVAENYAVKHVRSLKTFFVLSLKLLTDADVYFALRFENLIQRKNTPWYKHYTALDPASQNQLMARRERKKAGLSFMQKKFITVFNEYANGRGQRNFEKFLYQCNFPQLRDSLLVYIEVSQRLPDDNNKSLTAFYALSFRTLSMGDSYFAAQYEKYIHSEHTVWKQRYNALEWWQKDKLKETYKEKQTVRTADFQHKGKDIILKHAIPNTVPEKPADPEDERATPPTTAVQREFVKRFKAYMTARDKKTVKSFTEYIFARSFLELKDCLEAYLQASIPFGDDEWSIYIFFGVATRAIAVGDAYYAFKFNILINTAEALLARRYAALKPYQKTQLDMEIAKKEKRHRLIDDLKITYYKTHHKDPDLQSLRKFYISIDEEQNSKLSRHLSTCGHAYAVHNFERFQQGFDALSEHLHAQKDLIVFFGLLQRCRAATNVGTGLRRQLYWYIAGALFVRALFLRPEVYQRGLSDEEINLLFDSADRRDPYFSDFALRLDHLWMKRQSHVEFSKLSKACIGVHLYADRIAMRFIPLEEAAAVRGLVEALQTKKPEILTKIEIPIVNRFGKGVNLKINQTIGNVFIVWCDPQYGREVYVELKGFEGLLFGADLGRLAKAYDHDSVLGEIVRQTQVITASMPYLIAFITLLPDLVTGGLSGLVKAVVIDIAIERSANALGLNATGFQLVLLGSGLLRHGISSIRSKAKVTALSDSGIDNPGIDGRAVAQSLGEPVAANKTVGDQMASSRSSAGGDLPPAGRIHTDKPADIPYVSKAPVNTPDKAASHSLISTDGLTNPGTGSKATPQPPPLPATRQDLSLAERQLKETRVQLENAATQLEQAKMRTFDSSDRLEAAKNPSAATELKKKFEAAQAAEARARQDYKNLKYKVRAAESRVENVRTKLARRGQLDKTFIKEWHLPDKPVKFRRGTVELDSYSKEGFVGARPNRRDWERLLQEDPHGELSKRLLNPHSNPVPSKRTLYPANVGNEEYWKNHPEIVELAHVHSRRDGGPDVYILMTKERNQWYGKTIERPGGAVLTTEAVVIQGIAIERQSAIALGVPNEVVAKAPVIIIGK